MKYLPVLLVGAALILPVAGTAVGGPLPASRPAPESLRAVPDSAASRHAAASPDNAASPHVIEGVDLTQGGQPSVRVTRYRIHVSRHNILVASVAGGLLWGLLLLWRFAR